MTSFPSRIRHIQKDDPVSAGIASSPDKVLEARTNYLKEVIGAIEAGQALVQRDVAVRSDVLTGMPVYWDATNQYYAPAKAGVENDTTTNALVPTASSDVAGMVLTKKAGNLADVILWGLAQFSDLSNIIDESPIPTGRFYLSAQEEGKLVKQRPPVSVAVCLLFGPLDACDQNTWVLVMPQMRDFLEDHIHYQLELIARPAGEHTQPQTGYPHVITNADSTKQGWLPADDAVFGGNAPDGAVFGYNISAHPELERLWPPIPIGAVQLEMYQEGISHTARGLHHDFTYDFGSILANDFEETNVTVEGAMPHDAVVVNGEGDLPDDIALQAYIPSPGTVTIRAINTAGSPVNPDPTNYHIHVLKDPHDLGHIDMLHRVNSDIVKFDVFGIWWMTDCYDMVPWPSDYAEQSSSSSSSLSSPSSQSSDPMACPAVPDKMRLLLSFIKMTFATDKTVVTSLQPATGEPLKFVDCDGNEANTGDLFAQLILELLIDDAEYYGGTVLKGVTDDDKFKSGYAVEGLIAGSSKITLSSTRQRRLTPGDTSTDLVHQELVEIDVEVDPTDRELLPQIVVLGDAKERTYSGVTFYGFPNGKDSEIRVKFSVPPEGLPANPTLKIRAVIFGRGAGQLTDLDTSYRRLARPESGSPTAILGSDTTLTMDTDITVVADNAYEVESDAFSVEAGDTVFVTVARSASGSPSYAYEIGIVRIGAIIEGS